MHTLLAISTTNFCVKVVADVGEKLRGDQSTSTVEHIIQETEKEVRQTVGESSENFRPVGHYHLKYTNQSTPVWYIETIW